MHDASRLMRRLSYFPPTVCAWLTLAGSIFVWLTLASVISNAQTPALTTINEVRWSDAGWGQGNDRNLAGRFSSQTFTLPRLARIQNYFLRQYDASAPPRYSRYSTALHLDYPL
jgi:hypothetical protein